MAEEVPYTNTNDHVVHIGGKMIRPGETRMVDPTLLPDAHTQASGDETAHESDELLAILDGSVKDVTEALPGLSDEELDRLEAAEESGKTRKGVMEAIAEERLARADAAAEQANEDAGA